MNVAWRGTRRLERGSTGVETSSRMGVVTGDAGGRMRCHRNSIIDLRRGWTVEPSKTSSVSQSSQVQIKQYVMAEVLIFRICQNGDVARTVELSHSICDHSTYPPFQCIAIVQFYLGTAHSYHRRRTMQRGCVGGSALRKVQVSGKRLMRATRAIKQFLRTHRIMFLLFSIGPDIEQGERKMRKRERGSDKRKTKGKKEQRGKVFEWLRRFTRDGLELTLKLRHWLPHPIGYIYSDVMRMRLNLNNCLCYCCHSYDTRGRRARYAGENCGGCNRGGSTGG
ncbi:hypothetical protein ALC56_01992 [Trachymyrmex septentrionalis]|uniref:Uncharacterized protein n=1 Tax=Trachymyrmex septentrionalis TaxID=34720 RepID=A0A195FT10_9HYME|nr:hypothetical protein ALC56_01992 [Trachymyrmex septentrionalis]